MLRANVTPGRNLFPNSDVPRGGQKQTNKQTKSGFQSLCYYFLALYLGVGDHFISLCLGFLNHNKMGCFEDEMK